jgi:hypothetical protein
MIADDGCGAISGVSDWQGKPKCSEETCLNAALSTTDPTWLDPDRGVGKPAANRPSYCTVPVLARIPSKCVPGKECVKQVVGGTSRSQLVFVLLLRSRPNKPAARPK